MSNSNNSTSYFKTPDGSQVSGVALLLPAQSASAGVNVGDLVLPGQNGTSLGGGGSGSATPTATVGQQSGNNVVPVQSPSGAALASDSTVASVLTGVQATTNAVNTVNSSVGNVATGVGSPSDTIAANASSSVSLIALTKAIFNFASQIAQNTNLTNTAIGTLNSTMTGGNAKVQVTTLPTLPAGTNAIGSVAVSNFPATQAISATALPLPTGAAQDATLTGGNAKTQVTSLPALPAGSNAIGSVSVSNFPATQAVSATSLPLPTGATTAANQSQIVTNTANTVAAIQALPGTSASTPSYSRTAPSDGALATFSATATGVAGSVIDTTGFQSVAYAITSLPSGAALQVQESPDQTNWYSASLFNNTTVVYASSAVPSGVGVYRAAVGARYQRLLVTTYSSGTISVQVQQRGTPIGLPGLFNDLLADAALGTPADTAAANATASSSIVALLKGNLSSMIAIASQTNGVATAANQSTMQTTLNTIASNTGAGATVAAQNTGNSSLATIVNQTAGLATATAQTTGNNSLATLVNQTTNAATTTLQSAGNSSLATIATNSGSAATSALQTSGNTTLTTINTNLTGNLKTVAQAGTANMGRVGLPTSAGAAAAITATNSTANTASTVFTAGTIIYGAFVQNPASNTATIVIDWGGGTPSSPVAPQAIVPGQTVTATFVPTNAVTIWCVASASIPFNAGRF